mgnify:FL=1
MTYHLCSAFCCFNTWIKAVIYFKNIRIILSINELYGW